MKLDTPRTDAVEPQLHSNKGGWVRADFARQLERELAHSLANQVKSQAELEHIKALLKDIPAVHTNTLRGNIATLSWDSYEHIIGPHPCRERAENAEAEVERLSKLTEDCMNVIRVYCPTYYNDAMERFNKTNK